MDGFVGGRECIHGGDDWSQAKSRETLGAKAMPNAGQSVVTAASPSAFPVSTNVLGNKEYIYYVVRHRTLVPV